ncbi:hypothetical protein D3C76_882960 [compost metagenome]
MPGDGRETLFDPGEKQPFVLLRHKATEKGLVIATSQLPEERLHERGERGILLQGMVRIIRDIGDQRTG